MTADSATRIDEIAAGIFRISTPVPAEQFPGGFTFNQFLIADETPMLFHTGMTRLFDPVRRAIERVLPVATLRYVGFSHYEADECGALNLFLDTAPQAVAVCSAVGARVTISDFAKRAPRGLKHGECLALGAHSMMWLDAPHLPHGWDCGYMLEQTTGTLFCGDLFTQPGESHPPVTEADILAPSESLRQRINYYALSPESRKLLAALAATQPRMLACMHGAAWRGDGAAMLMALADALEARAS
jgi:flavorubredoxin